MRYQIVVFIMEYKEVLTVIILRRCVCYVVNGLDDYSTR